MKNASPTSAWMRQERNLVIDAHQPRNLRLREAKRFEREAGHCPAGYLILGKSRHTLPRHFPGDAMDCQVAREGKTRLSIDRKRRRHALNPVRNEFGRRKFGGFERPGPNIVIAPGLYS